LTFLAKETKFDFDVQDQLNNTPCDEIKKQNKTESSVDDADNPEGPDEERDC